MRQIRWDYWINFKQRPQATGGSANLSSHAPEHIEALKMNVEFDAEKALRAAEAGVSEGVPDTQTDGGEGIVPDLPMNEEELQDALETAVISGLEEGRGQPPYYA